MSELTRKSLSQLAALISSRKVSPVEVMEAYLTRIEQVNPALNAIVTIAPDASEKAREAEVIIMKGKVVGPLHGVPITIKDTIETKDLRTTAGSRVRADYVPNKDAEAVARLRKAGAIVLGKTNTAEMATSYDTENPVFGHANNPYDLDRTSGGSSGGEASAIAACLSPGGLGSDLMGSVRVPAHFCGIVGLKPTTERVLCTGHIPPASGLPASLGAVIGPMARTVEDISTLFRVISRVSGQEQPPETLAEASTSFDTRGLRAAWHTFDGISPVTEDTRAAVLSAAHALEDEGLNVIEEKPPGVERGQALWSLLFARAALEHVRKEYAGREDQAGPFIRYLIDSASEAPTQSLDEFSRARIERDDLRTKLVEWMNKTPLIIAPVGAMPATKHGTRKVEVEGQSLSIFRAFSYAQTYNVFGFPAVSVPAGRSREGLPIGVQIIGRPFEEEHVLAAARIVEQAFGGWQMPPHSSFK